MERITKKTKVRVRKFGVGYVVGRSLDANLYIVEFSEGVYHNGRTRTYTFFEESYNDGVANKRFVTDDQIEEILEEVPTIKIIDNPNPIITDWNEIMTMQGELVSCRIRGTLVKMAQINIIDGALYLCQNEESGANLNILPGWMFSYSVYSPHDLTEFSIKRVGFNIYKKETLLDNYGEEINKLCAIPELSNNLYTPIVHTGTSYDYFPEEVPKKGGKNKKTKKFTVDEYPDIKIKSRKRKISLEKDW